MRARIPLFVCLLLLLASPALAQTMDTLTNPISEPFENIVLVKGRVVTADDQPMSKVRIEVGLAGLEDIRVKPMEVVTKCNGDFQVWFEIGDVSAGATAFVRLLEDQAGNTVKLESVGARATLDPHFRVADLTLTVDEEWDYVCSDASEYWPKRLTLWGRFVNGTDFYVRNDTVLSAHPIQWERVNLTIEVDGVQHRPHFPVGTDARGDFIWSWIFEEELEHATVYIYRDGNAVFNATWDGDPTRLVVANLDFGNGRPPAPAGTPAPGLLAAVAAVAIAGALMRRR